MYRASPRVERMAAAKKIKVGAVHTSLYANLRLLMCTHNHSPNLAELLTEDVFVLPNSNKKASNEVIHFLLTVWDKPKCMERFKFCWPVLDRKQESQFQRSACTIMQEIKTAHPEARLPTVSLALFLQPGGTKYCNFLLRLTTFLLTLSMKGIDIESRPMVKKGQNIDDIKRELKTLAKNSLERAVESSSGCEATLKASEDFSQKLKSWWSSWEESEETALENFRNEVLKLDLTEELKDMLLEDPEKVKEFSVVVKELVRKIHNTLDRLEGVENKARPQSLSNGNHSKEATTLKEKVELKTMGSMKKGLTRGHVELKLMLDLATQQEAWPLHPDVTKLKEKMQNGQPAEMIKQLEARLEAAKGPSAKAERKKSNTPSPPVNITPCILRRVPYTPLFTSMTTVAASPFKSVQEAIQEEEEEPVEHILLRWHQPHLKWHGEQTHAAPQPATPHEPHASPTFMQRPMPVIKESPKSPTEKSQTHKTKVEIPVPAPTALTPPSEAYTRRLSRRRSFFDLSGDELPLGDVSLLELAEMHLTLSGNSSPEPDIDVPAVLKEEPQFQSTPEPVDVKPDLRILIERLQAIKNKSKGIQSVLIKSELVSP